MEMKYEMPEAEIIEVECEDIILVSGDPTHTEDGGEEEQPGNDKRAENINFSALLLKQRETNEERELQHG